jgi:hypothetical protein
MIVKTEIDTEAVLLDVGLDNTGEEPLIDRLRDARTGKEIDYYSLDDIDQGRILFDALEEIESRRADEAAHRMEDWT